MRNKKSIGLAAGIITTLLTVGTFTMPAYAGSNTNNGHNSGGYCGPSSAGCSNAFNHTICAAAGAFGAFGPEVNFGNAVSGHIDEPGGPNSTSPNSATVGNGADGPLTGTNNSNICGSPQN